MILEQALQFCFVFVTDFFDADFFAVFFLGAAADREVVFLRVVFFLAGREAAAVFRVVFLVDRFDVVFFFATVWFRFARKSMPCKDLRHHPVLAAIG